MNTFYFWKDNKTDGRFELSVAELKERFTNWLKSKDNEWLTYYYSRLIEMFVGDKDGLSSVTDNVVYDEMNEALTPDKWKYLNSIGFH